MRVKGISENQLNTCLNKVNKEQGYELIYNREPEKKGNFLHFTIKSKKSGISGARYSASGRKLINASWHAHGYLFDAILELNPNSIIYSGTNKITFENGNWQDWNCGSMFEPCYMSETSIL